MQTRLIFIRHGETDLNLQRRYLGGADADLNNNGTGQAMALEKKLREEIIGKVFSSGSTRAVHFAALVFKGHPLETIPELREMGFGIFEGSTHEELMQRHPDIYNNWLGDPLNTAIPGGERFDDFKKRVLFGYRKVAALGEGMTSAIVTHAGPIRVIVNEILGSDDIWSNTPRNASITIIEIKKGEAGVIQFDDTGHLKDG